MDCSNVSPNNYEIFSTNLMINKKNTQCKPQTLSVFKRMLKMLEISSWLMPKKVEPGAAPPNRHPNSTLKKSLPKLKGISSKKS